MFVLDEFDTGYIWNKDRRGLGVTSSVVLHLAEKLRKMEMLRMHFFTNCFYTKLGLAKELYDWKVI